MKSCKSTDCNNQLKKIMLYTEQTSLIQSLIFYYVKWHEYGYFRGKKKLCIIIFCYKTENALLSIKFNNIGFRQPQSVSTGSVRDVRIISIQSHACQITVHIINIQCVQHLYWQLLENNASLKTRECWTMLVECHSRSWLMFSLFPPTLAVY